MASNQKDTIFVDVDDEITAIIDKVVSSKSRVVALVLPKRASAMQSLVNMKLLKRSADDAEKNLVLVTTESGLMPLAGSAGLFVASTATSKPKIPSQDEPDSSIDIQSIDEPNEDEQSMTFNARANEDKPLSELAGPDENTMSADDEQAIELDNTEPAEGPIIEQPRKSKDKSLKVPSFKKFRFIAFIVVALVVAVGVLAYLSASVWPHATVKIYTSQNSVPVSFTADLETGATEIDPVKEILPAVAQTVQKSYSQTVPASGQKDEGTPATGSVVLNICTNNPKLVQTVQAGTGVSTNNLTYITQNDANFNFTGGGNGCFNFTSNSVGIIAQSPGSNYNVSSATFTVAGSSATGTGNATGGTSNVVRVVQQSDIDSAKQQLTSQQDSSVKQTLQSQLSQNNLVPLAQTYSAIPSNVQSSANVGDQAQNVTVTENVTYQMFGVKKSDLASLVSSNAQSTSNTNQGVLDDGINSATYTLNGQPSSTSASLGISTTVTMGPKLDTANLKQQIAGKRAGDIRNEIGSVNGVSKVDVNISPFWADTAPKNLNKITVEFQKTNG